MPSQGQVNFNSVGAAGGIGWIAEKTGILGGNGGLFNWGNRGACCSPMDQPVTRYELGMEQALAAKDSEIALLKANTYQDQKSLELYKYVDSSSTQSTRFLLHRQYAIRQSTTHPVS